MPPNLASSLFNPWPFDLQRRYRVTDAITDAPEWLVLTAIVRGGTVYYSDSATPYGPYPCV
jgi:hypothetical protein